MMEPELMQQLRVDDPMEEPELNLDGLQISSIQVLLEPPTTLISDEDDEDDGFYSPLDHFQNLVKLSMSSSQCQSLDGFPHLPLLRSLLLADNNISSGFEALAEADLQNLVRLDLSGNQITDVSVLAPLDALGNLQHLSLAENEVANQENYRDEVFDILPQLITVDGLDRDGTELEVDDDEAVSSGGEDVHDEENVAEGEDEGEYQIDDAEADLNDEEDYEGEGQQSLRHQAGDDESEELGSDDENDDEEEEDEDEEAMSDRHSDSDDQEDRPMVGGKTADSNQLNDDEEDDDELEDEDEEGIPQQAQHEEIASGSEDEDDEVEEEEDEDDEEDMEEDDDEERPGLAYLLADDIQDENDDEFEPGNEVEEDSEIESSDEDEFGTSVAPIVTASTGSSSSTNGHHPKRPRSPTLLGTGDFDDGQAGDIESASGFDVDGVDATNGFGMAPFDGPATFDEETTHESKRQRT
ncbi:hypothetical protein BGZ51_007061 [Haplosporangium sp. Z 767]|nr:hypothetical protein BGZ51_007061 [Haplosporangium sp. Z 767]